MMKLLDLNIKGAIFDLDGTLIDSTGIWHQIDVDFFGRRNMDVPKDYALKISHLGLLETAKFAKSEYNLPDSVEDMLNEWKHDCEDYYLNKIQLKPYAKEILEFCKENNIKVALATVNDRYLYEACLKRLGVYQYFDYFVDLSISKVGKTSPRIYDCASEYLGLTRDQVVVVEDIPACLVTAKTNGYKTIGVYDKNSSQDDKKKKQYSDIFVHSFDELM